LLLFAAPKGTLRLIQPRSGRGGYSTKEVVLFSRVPEGQNTDPLQWKIPRLRVIADASPFYEAGLVGAGFVGAGPARERERSSRQDARELSNGSINSVSGTLPAGKAGLSLASKLPQIEFIGWSWRYF
tara:strand:- start:48 stop:431 length:384 start_codon:yes stop_codon:yes gene_type:complete